MIAQNLIGNDIYNCSYAVTDVNVPRVSVKGSRKARGLACVVVGGRPYQPYTPGFYDFEVRTGLERYDCVRS